MNALSKNKTLKTAIVILNYNGKHFLEQFIKSVVDFSTLPDVSIYVADNASTDDSVSFLKENFPQIKLIILNENFGYAGGYNKALLEVNAEYYILLNSDVEVSENWIEPIIKYMDSHQEVVACQPKILAYHDKKRFEHAGAAGGFIDKYGYPFCRGRVLGKAELDEGQYDTIEEIFWASGACLFIRKNDFWEVGGFDASFFAHMEEIDLCWRLKSRGKHIACVPESVIYHVGGGTLTVESPKKTYLNYRNNLLMIYKNIATSKLNNVLLVRWFLDYLSALQMFLAGKKENARNVLKARRDFNKKKIVYKHRRKENLESTVEMEPTGFLNKSIVFNYYILNRKKYTELIK